MAIMSSITQYFLVHSMMKYLLYSGAVWIGAAGLCWFVFHTPRNLRGGNGTYPNLWQGLGIFAAQYCLVYAATLPLPLSGLQRLFPQSWGHKGEHSFFVAVSVSLVLFFVLLIRTLLDRTFHHSDRPLHDLFTQAFSMGRLKEMDSFRFWMIVFGVTSLLSLGFYQSIFFIKTGYARPPAGSLDVPELLAAHLIAPISEEFLFRWVLLRGFLNRHGKMVAIVMSSLLFALTHGPGMDAYITTFLMGLCYGWLVVETNSIIPALIAHSMHNGLLTLDKFFLPIPHSTLFGPILLCLSLLMLRLLCPRPRGALVSTA